MMFIVVICPPIHNIVVVIVADGRPGAAGIGCNDDDAGKEEAVGMVRQSFRISEIITMVVVRLSNRALRKNVTKPTSHISVDNCWVRMRLVMTSKLLCASTTNDGHRAHQEKAIGRYSSTTCQVGA